MAVPDGLPWGATAMTRQPYDAREAEFAAIFEEFSSPIYNYVLRMVNDHDRAADITQDTFIKAYRKLDTLSETTSVRSWLYRIATNTAIDDMRRRRNVTTMSDDQPTFANRADARPGPEAQVMAATLDERVQRALMSLRPNHRQCLLLSDLEDMSAQQIGEVMGHVVRRGAHAPVPRPRRDAARPGGRGLRAMTMNRHEPFEELISASLHGDLTADERRRLDAHLDACDQCRGTLAAFAEERRMIAGLRHVAPPRDLGARVRAGIEYASVPWWRKPTTIFTAVGGTLAAVAGALLALVVLNGTPSDPQVGQTSPTPTAGSRLAVGNGCTRRDRRRRPRRSRRRRLLRRARRPAPPPTPDPDATPNPIAQSSPEPDLYVAMSGPADNQAMTVVEPASSEPVVEPADTPLGPPIAAELSPDGGWLAYGHRAGTERHQRGARDPGGGGDPAGRSGAPRPSPSRTIDIADDRRPGRVRRRSRVPRAACVGP